jgi:energy-coupling factor transporter ATP-binding protein EcfA2
VALAVQLVRRPRLLLLDEPLAGLDWRTRAELIQLLVGLKAECTMLVVSHDLRELAPLVDAAWEMRPGGRLEASSVARLPSLL